MSLVDEELENGVRLQGPCVLDVSIDLVVELDNPGTASVAMTSEAARRVTEGQPIPFLFNPRD